jgi:hypothetical protein
MKKIQSIILGLFLIFIQLSAFASVPSVCPGYAREGGKDDNFEFSQVFSYGFHINLNLTGTKLAGQTVKYAYLDNDSKKILKQGNEQGGSIVIDEMESTNFRPYTSNSVSTVKNRKLIVWGLDYQGYKVGTELYLTLSLRDVKLQMNNDITADLFGLTGDYSYSYKSNLVAGIKVEQDSDEQFAQAGCGEETLDRFSFGHHWFMGNLHPKLIINATGSLQYQLNHFADYTQSFESETKSYTLKTTKVVENQ